MFSKNHWLVGEILCLFKSQGLATMTRIPHHLPWAWWPINRLKPNHVYRYSVNEHCLITVGAYWKELEVWVQIWFLYWLDIVSWMFQRHLKISMCETALMVFAQTRASFSVHPVLQLRDLKVILYASIFLTLPRIQSITWSCGFYPCNISNLPVYLHLCCLHPSPGYHCLLPELSSSNQPVSNHSLCTLRQSDLFKVKI